MQVRKKVLVFVASVDSGVRLRLLLESFGVRAALLNAELPVNSRSHILATFNRGLFDYLIATDDAQTDSAAAAGAAAKVAARGRNATKRAAAAGGRGAKRKRDADADPDGEFGVTRGIDFKGVRTVLNFEPPATLQARSSPKSGPTDNNMLLLRRLSASSW
jgi:ATP-dependent RNA helicase DDX56/DBP9